MGSGTGGIIAAVERGSVGEAAGLRSGDRLVVVNGHPVHDVIDVQFYGADEVLDLQLERDGQVLHFRAERAYGQTLGLEFAHPTFDVDIRRCSNNCEFCFVKMNAPGMRRSLYVKDDDYRHSFLSGSFVTLTNLTQDDWDRLEEQHLSPLYVSVQTTDGDLRRRMLGRQDTPDILDQLLLLAQLDIEVHTQVVMVPGVNDGLALAQTVADLVKLYGKPVLSVSIVPIGLTRFHAGSCRPYSREESALLLAQTEPWRSGCRAELGCTFLYPSDEWYLVAGRKLPPAEEYDGFPQVENGVGMVRQLLDEWQVLKAAQARKPDLLSSATLVCGSLIAPVLGRIVDEWNALTHGGLRLVPVANDFFGPVTTVSGLLTGGDVVAALRGRDLGQAVLLPRSMFTGRYGAGGAPPGMTLDDLSLDDISAQLGMRAEMAGTLAEVVPALTRTDSAPCGLVS
jgi:putative radical SAM enzyme (TIGR03279 family)